MNIFGPEMMNFTPDLISWNTGSNRRSMPWKGEKDPYKIWLSEVILQQTRVSQGWAYYEKFIAAFPNVFALAKAEERSVFKLWEGLGYYSRCRNLLATARQIVESYNGVFPSTYTDILALKGIGPYTASAIASFAFDLPHAVVDGNVSRVLSRCFGISLPVDSTKGRLVINDLAKQLLDAGAPGEYNQAIMDLGATICKPVAPDCLKCPFRDYCLAYKNGMINKLPVKSKKGKIYERWFYYIVMEVDENIILQKREDKDIWQGLYEFVLIEKAKETESSIIINDVLKRFNLNRKELLLESISPVIKQQLSHQKIKGKFFKLKMKSVPKGFESSLVAKDILGEYAFPRFINSYLCNYYA